MKEIPLDSLPEEVQKMIFSAIAGDGIMELDGNRIKVSVEVDIKHHKKDGTVETIETIEVK